MRPGGWTKVDRASFEEAVRQKMKEVEARASLAPLSSKLRLVPFSKALRILPRWLEESLPFLMPRGPIYGFEAFAFTPEGEVPLGAVVIVGIYDEGSGEGVIVDDEWIDAQLVEVEELLREALGSGAP